MVKPIPIEEIKRVAPGISIAALDRKELPYVELSDSEIKIVKSVFNSLVAQTENVAPKIARQIAKQEELAIKMAAVAKATFPTLKNFSFPSVPGSLGVAPLFPQAIKWTATPSDADPCYTSYLNNSWDFELTAGTPAYLFGSADKYYRACPHTERHTFILVFENGVVEVGSTPSIDQFRVISEAKGDYGIYTVSPLVDIPLESGKVLYQYPTPLGALFITHDRGIKWEFMPRISGRKTIKLLGLVFYEHDFMARLKWI